MALYCTPCTGTDLVNIPFDSCTKYASLMKAGISNLIFIKCGSTFTDITDEAEWSNLIYAGDAYVTQTGKAPFPQPAYEDLEVNACGTMWKVDGKMTIDFKSYILDPSTDAHNTFINLFNNSSTAYTAAFVGCDGFLYYNTNWVTTENPGFGIYSGNAWLADEGKYKTLAISEVVDVSEGLYKSFLLTTAMQSALGLN